jgi:glycosyltransferase involved in cell wall biosynthesis
LPSILEGKDVGIVPPVWWDPAPQVVMELLANNIPVIAANIGGIPDFIENGVNGLLFQAGNSEDLSAKICYILDNPKMLNEWRNHIQSIKTIEQHVDELQLFYGF